MRSFKSWVLVLAAVGAFTSLSAKAQHVFRPYVGLSQTDYTIKFDNNAFPGYANKTAKSDYLAPMIGFTWVSPKRIYVDAQFQGSLSATHDLWKDLTSQDQDFSRSTYTITGGYVHVLQSGFSISGFGGVTGGKSTLKAPGQPFMAWTEDVFTSGGLFVGVGGGIPLAEGRGGQITVSVALAFIGGTWTDNNGFRAEATPETGGSFGIGYTYRITPAWGITADYRVQNYSYTFDPPGTAPDYTVKESTKALGLRVSYQF